MERRSAKRVCEDFAEELLLRKNDPDAKIKLLTIQTIALRAGWRRLYNRLRFQEGLYSETATDKWWQR